MMTKYTLNVSKKKIIIGILIVLGISYGISLILPVIVQIPLSIMITIFVLAKYWNRSKRSIALLIGVIALLIVVLAAVDFGIVFLLPFPFNIPISFIVDFLIIVIWFKRKKIKIKVDP
jgi:ABC-type nickel/cobalt efflux system permease component RcnA